MVNVSCAGLFGAGWPPSLSLLSAQEVSMATLHPVPLQPVLHSQCQLFCPMVHCPLPLHWLGQPSAKEVGHRDKERGRDRVYTWSKRKVSHKIVIVKLGVWLKCSIVPKGMHYHAHSHTCNVDINTLAALPWVLVDLGLFDKNMYRSSQWVNLGEMIWFPWLAHTALHVWMWLGEARDRSDQISLVCI